nr:hypothetical protein [Micromonospora sp. DSM 115978]
MAAGLVLGLTLVAGCSSEGASVDCRVDATCDVTFDRKVDAAANVLGVEAKLVAVDGEQVTVEVAGEQVSLWMNEPATEVAGLAVNLERITSTEVVVRLSQA